MDVDRIRRALSKQRVQTWQLLGSDGDGDAGAGAELCTSHLRNGWCEMNVERLQIQTEAEEEEDEREEDSRLDHFERAELELAAAFEGRRELLARQRAAEERARADLMRDQFLAGQVEWWKLEEGAFAASTAEPEDPHRAEPPVEAEAEALPNPFDNADADGEVADTISAAGAGAATATGPARADTPTPTTPPEPSGDATDTASEASTSSEVTIDSISRAELASRLHACLVEGIVINRFNEVRA